MLEALWGQAGAVALAYPTMVSLKQNPEIVGGPIRTMDAKSVIQVGAAVPISTR
jgi:hypothetical protein